MSSVVKEGYLTKRAVRGVGSNRRRWITLRENSIEWSERQKVQKGVWKDDEFVRPQEFAVDANGYPIV